MLRKTFTLIAALTLMAMAHAQTQLPNVGFEQWTGNKPTGWDASNFVAGIFNIQTVFKDTAAPAEGLSNALLQTKLFNLVVVTPTIPGIVTLGTIVVNTTTFTGTVEGGIPFTGRPLSLKGYINAQPVAGDSGMIAIGFSKWDGTKRDTIGEGIAWYATPHNEWVAFDVPITFTSAQNPDSLNIIVSCSAVGNEVFLAGSQMRIDSLAFNYGPISVEVYAQDPEFSVWADAGQQLHYSFKGEKEQPTRIGIFQVNGAEVISTLVNPGSETGTVDLRQMPAGIYILRLLTNENKVYTRKFTVR